MPDTRFVLEADGAVYRETVERRRVAADVAKTFADSALAAMQIVTPSLGKSPAFDQLRLAFPLKRRDGQPLAAAARLSGLNFRTSWAETEDGFLIPTFDGNGAQVDPALVPGGAFKCPMPEWAETWLVFLLPGNGRANFTAWLPTLVRVRDKGACQWRWSMLPVPNQHGNGALCFGTAPGGLDWGNLLKLAGQLAETWFASPWNTDLYTTELSVRFKKMFRWQASDGKFVPGTREVWAENSRAFADVGDASVDAFLAERLAEKGRE